MRVLLTTDTVGGVWTFTRELAEGLLQKGNSVALASFGRAPSPEQSGWANALESLHHENFLFSASDIPLEWMTENVRASSEGNAALARIIDQFAPDLLHSSQFCFGALPCQLPRLITAHSDVLSWADACRLQGLDNSSWLDQYKHIVQAGLSGANTIVAPTRAMLHALERNFHLPASQHVIANGRSLHFAAGPPPDRIPQAVTAGRLWDEAKNVDLLTRVNSPIPLIVAGEQRFSEQQTELDAPTLLFTGALPEQHLLHLFRSSTVYIAPSRYEPFGLAPLEAALCGCAILANDLPSLREVWADAAIYFNDSASLEHLLHRLTEDADLLARAQQRAHLRALTFSRAAMVTRYAELYRQLIDASQQPARPAQTRERQRVA